MAKILFVDDDSLTLELMGRLVNLLGHQAVLTHNGTAALEVVLHDCPELILVDLSLPDQDGIEIIRQIRKVTGNYYQPLIYVLSAGFPSQTLEKARLAGAEGCLQKPLSLDVLSSLVKKIPQP